MRFGAALNLDADRMVFGELVADDLDTISITSGRVSSRHSQGACPDLHLIAPQPRAGAHPSTRALAVSRGAPPCAGLPACSRRRLWVLR